MVNYATGLKLSFWTSVESLCLSSVWLSVLICALSLPSFDSSPEG